MSLEIGGRADKRGNTYENRFFARLLIQLITEKVEAVVVEPLGEGSEAYEYYTIDSLGKETYYQCKVTNGTNDHWRPSDLNSNNVFSRSKKLLLSDPLYNYVFVSPYYYDELDELCNRARTCGRPEEILLALTNPKIKQAFKTCERYYELHQDDSLQLEQLVSILSRCRFIVIPDNILMVSELNQVIEAYFTGNPDVNRLMLENYANDGCVYGTKITSSLLIGFLQSKGVLLRDIRFDSRIVPRINRLNELFVSSFHPFSDRLINREYTKEIISAIEAGKSVIAHGKAGVGKSGCMQELVQQLIEKKIPYLAVRLDKYTPNGFADEYGRALGLEESPVFCLNRVAAGEECVLILDQLDALRWSSANTSTALDVCKEMISQAKNINAFRGGHVSIVFCTRTFDYENDNRIRGLFELKEKDNESPWVEVRIYGLTNQEAQQIIGNDYDPLPRRLKELLRTPSALYVWLKLCPERRKSILSSQQLIRSWWAQILEEYDHNYGEKAELNDCVERIVSIMSNNSSFSIPAFVLQNQIKEINYLLSAGLIISNNDVVSFTHQSILDAFLIQRDLEYIYGDGSLLQTVLRWGMQTPDKRYRLSALLQYIIESDTSFFVNQSTDMLLSNRVHFFFKCAVFEVMGQYSDPGPDLISFAVDFYGKPEWHNFIVNTVFSRHFPYIRHLLENGKYDWISGEGISLLWTIQRSNPQFVSDVLRKSIEEAPGNIKKVMQFLGNTIDEEPEELFQLRLDLYEANHSLLGDLHYIDLIDAAPSHITKILKLFLSDAQLYCKTHIIMQSGREIDEFLKRNYQFVLSELFVPLCESAAGVRASLYSNGSFENRVWYPKQYEQSIIRAVVVIVKSALCIMAETNPEEAQFYLSQSREHVNVISNELALAALTRFPTSYSDYAIQWLLCDFSNNIADCTGDETDYLRKTKEIIKKHSAYCSEDSFVKLEETILTWRDSQERMVERYKRRIEYNQQKNGHEYVYWAFWGNMQKALLPELEMSRVLQKTKDLIRVLERNEWVSKSAYNSGYYFFPAKSVVSTLHGHAERLSDQAWLSIVSQNIKEKHFWRPSEKDEPYYYETSHPLFASEMGACAERDPVRFAKLSLRFPDNVDSSYVNCVLNSLINAEDDSIEFDLLCQVVRQYMTSKNDNTVLSVLRVLYNHAELNWPEDVLRFVVDVATGDMRPVENEYVFSTETDEERARPSTLESNAINLPRSKAIFSIAKLIDIHSNLYEFFATSLYSLCQDKSDVVRYSLVQFAVASYQYDPIFAKRLYDTLLSKDLRVLGSHNAFWLMSRDEQVLLSDYIGSIQTACESSCIELAKTAAHCLTATAIVSSDQQAINHLITNTWPPEVLDEICDELTEAFGHEQYRVISEHILKQLLLSTHGNSNKISGLFYNENLSIDRDKDIILLILRQHKSIDTVYAFVEFLKRQNNPSISAITEILAEAVSNLIDQEEYWKWKRIEDSIVNAVMKLINRSNCNDAVLEKCLSILDDLFRVSKLTSGIVAKLLDGAQ